MKAEELLEKVLARLHPSLVAHLEPRLQAIPAVRRRIEGELARLMGDMEEGARPYRRDFPTHSRLPAAGLPREEILGVLESLRNREEDRWKDGFVSGAVYHGDPAHTRFLARVYELHSQVNPLHSDIWPSASKFEAEIVAMTARMLGADDVEVSDPEKDAICGTVTSGGTESILLAMKTYRDRGRARGLRRPEIVAPITAHAAFDKAAQYFGIRLTRTPVDDQGRALTRPMIRAMNDRTVALVGSAPCFPYGVVDPISELAEAARTRGIGFHTDACLGGFILPWAGRAGRRVDPFDFSVPGVTSMSADTHKFGYAAKGTSVVLYRGLSLRRLQYYAVSDWPGGLYFSPTLAGSRPGALSATCWAAMLSMGEAGYAEAAARIFEATDWIRQRVRRHSRLALIGDSLFMVAFRVAKGDPLDVYSVMDAMSRRGWNLNGLHRPPACHLCVTLRHTEPGVKERFADDLEAAVAHVEAHPEERRGMAPVYGMAATLPLKGVVGDMLKRYVDLLYKV